MKIRLMAHEDDTFTLEVDTIPGLDPTGAEADFITQLLETAFPNTAMQEFVHDQVRRERDSDAVPVRDIVSKFLNFTSHTDDSPAAVARKWSEFAVDAVRAAGVDRDLVLRELAMELNRQGVGIDGELRIKGGKWVDRKIVDVMTPELQEEVDLQDAEVSDEEGPPSPRRSTPTPLDVLGRGARDGKTEA
jgi:hypothetical protein